MSDFRTRLYNFEIPPPLIAWDKIILALDEATFKEVVSSKLQDAHIPPPDVVWKRISSSLDENEPQKESVPFFRRIQPYYRYAAAAVLLGIVTFTISLFMAKENVANISDNPLSLPGKEIPSTDKTDNDQIIRKNEPFEEGSVTSIAPNKKAQVTSSVFTNRKNLKDIFREKYTGRLNQPRSPAILQTNYSPDELEKNMSRVNSSGWSLAYDHSKTEVVNNYIMLLRPEGYLIRMSKKFVDMIGCMFNSPAIPENQECSDQLKKWREKIARSPVSPTPENFMDILTLIKSLEEN